MQRTYIVIESTPGYLPEQVVGFTNKREAQQYALALARELRELGYKVHGSMRDGYYYAEKDQNDLGRVIEILPNYDYDD